MVVFVVLHLLSNLWGHCSSLWVCLLCGSMVGLIQHASLVCCCQSPCPHCRPLLIHSKASLAQSLVGSLGPGMHKVLFQPSEHLWKVWALILNVIFPLLPFSRLLLCPWMRCLFWVGSTILPSVAVQPFAAILEFSEERIHALPSTLPSFGCLPFLTFQSLGKCKFRWFITNNNFIK